MWERYGCDILIGHRRGGWKGGQMKSVTFLEKKEYKDLGVVFWGLSVQWFAFPPSLFSFIILLHYPHSKWLPIFLDQPIIFYGSIKFTLTNRIHPKPSLPRDSFIKNIYDIATLLLCLSFVCSMRGTNKTKRRIETFGLFHRLHNPIQQNITNS